MVLLTLNKLPAPLSLMVATPVVLTLPVVLAIKLNVSSRSQAASLIIAVRTNNVVPVPEVPAGI